MIFISLLATWNILFLMVNANGQGENHNIVVTSPGKPEVGSETTLACDVPASDPRELVECRMVGPNGDTYLVEDGQVMDANSNVVDNYSGLSPGTPPKTCGIVIDQLASEDLGDWKCLMKRSGGAIPNIEGFVNLRLKGDRLPGTLLPEGIVPNRYGLEIVPIIVQDFSFSGRIVIDMAIAADNLGSITLHTKDLDITEESLSAITSEGDTLAIASIGFDFERDFFQVSFNPPSTPAAFTAQLTIEFQLFKEPWSVLSRSGFYMDNWIDSITQEKHLLAVTQFQPTSAREAFPCFDEPRLKAKFQVSVGTPPGYTAQSNEPLIRSSNPVDGFEGYVWYEFEESVPMSSYLVAFLVSEMDKVCDGDSNGYPVCIVARPNAIARGYGSYAVEQGPAILEFFQEYTGHDYADLWSKMDLSAIPSKGGAMENPGLNTYGERELLIDESQSGANDLIKVAEIMSHELGHQWFGNRLTCQDFGELYLNEGFATFMQFKGPERIAPDFKSFEKFYRDQMLTVLREDAYVDSHPIIDVDFEDGREANFGRITYNKGGSILRMVEAILTDPSWRRGLQAYLQEPGVATSPNLWRALEQAGRNDGTFTLPITLEEVMEAWTKSKNYPLLTMTRDYEGGTASFAQERFLYEPDTTGDDTKYAWWIPVTMGIPGSDFDTHNDEWLGPDEAELTLTTSVGSDVAILANNQATGFFRVNYDDNNWALIAQQLLVDHTQISALDRAKSIHDAMALAEAGYISYYVVLNLLEYLPKETEYLPLSVAIYSYQDLQSDPTSDNQAVLDFLRSTFEEKYRVIGMNEDLQGTVLDHQIQRTLINLLCGDDSPDCAADAVAVFAQWMASSQPDDSASNPVNRHSRSPIYCAGISNGGVAEYQFAQARLDSTDVPQERSALSSALFCYNGQVGVWKGFCQETDPTRFLSVRDKVEILEQQLQSPAQREAFLTQATKCTPESLKDPEIMSTIVRMLRNFGNSQVDLQLFARFAQHVELSPPATMGVFRRINHKLARA